MNSVMRLTILIALALTAGSAALAASSATFTGGRGDGWARGDFISARQPTAALHFIGGNRDGYASSSWRGYQPAAVPALVRFVGGIRDGYASSKMLSSWSQTKPARFLGGSFDGYDSQAVRGLPNWAVGDTDGNGLPDWWELKYFGVLTGTRPNADADHDGVSNLQEYLTGTNPTNSSSYFHITRLKPGLPNKIFVYSEPGYLYTLQRTDDPAAAWMNVPNQVRISTAVEDELEMDDNFGAASGFYRVLSEH